MTKEEMRSILRLHLAQFRRWSHERLAGCIAIPNHDDEPFLTSGIAADGTAYQIETSVLWDDEEGGPIRVTASFLRSPLRPLFGILPLYTPEAIESFILAPDGNFMDE